MIFKSSFFIDMENNSSKEEIERIIEQGLMQGKDYKEIAKEIDRSLPVFFQMKKKLIQKGIISEEQIEKAKNEKKKEYLVTDPKMQKIMEYIKEGLPQTDIAKLVNTKPETIAYIIKRFKQYGLITQQEIEEAREERSKKIRSNDVRKEQVLEQLMQGRTKKDLASELGLSETTLKVIQDSLIDEGRITQNQIEEAVEKQGKQAQKRNKVIQMLMQGYKYEDICQEVGYSHQTVSKIKKQAIRDGRLTEEEYQQAKKQRQSIPEKTEKQNEKENTAIEQQVLELLRKGKCMYFMRKKTGLSRDNIQSIVKKLIKQGEITQSEIDIASKEDAKEAEKKVLIGLKKGYSQRAIVGMFEKGEYTIAYVRARIQNLKEAGQITDKEIEEYKCKAEQVQIELQEFILGAVEQGLTLTTMTELGKDKNYTKSMIQHAIVKMKQQGAITEKDIKQGRKIREESKHLKTQEGREKKEKEIIYLLMVGLSGKEIGEKLGYSEATVNSYVSRLRKQGKVSDEEIRKSRQRRREEQKKSKDNKRDLERTDLNSFLRIAKLYLNKKDYQDSINILKFSKQFLSDEEDLLRIDQALETIYLYISKIEADQMMNQGYSIEEIQERTKLSLEEIIELRYRKVQSNRTNSIEENKSAVWYDNELPDL